MKQVISIDDSTKKGRLLLELLREFKGTGAVRFLSSSEQEEMEDEILLRSMESGLESGVADSSEIYKKLGVK